MSVLYGEGLKGELFDFVHTICETEVGVSLLQSKFTKWFARPDIFPAYLELKPIVLDYRADNPREFLIKKFNLLLEDGEIGIEIAREDEGDLVGDPHASHMLQAAQTLYFAHDHENCIAAVAEPTAGHKALPRLRGLNGEVLA